MKENLIAIEVNGERFEKVISDTCELNDFAELLSQAGLMWSDLKLRAVADEDTVDFISDY